VGAHAEALEVIFIEHLDLHVFQTVKLLTNTVDEGLRVDHITGFRAEVSRKINRRGQVAEVAGELISCAGVVAENPDAAQRRRIEAILVVTIEAIVTEPIAKCDARCGCIVVPVDTRPEDIGRRAARTVVEARSFATEIFSSDTIERISTDTDQIDA
jgi:hypothetical protein